MSQKNPLAWGVVAIVLVSGCLFAALSTNGQKTDRPDSNTWRLAEPIRYENLSVFPVVSSRSANTGGFSTLDEALVAGEAVVTESGGDVMQRSRDGRPVAIPEQRGASVNQLVLINRGSKPLVLLAGELVS